MQAGSPLPPDRAALPPGDVVPPRADAVPARQPDLLSGWFRRQMVLRLAAAALCVGATAVVATGPPWPIGDQRARAHATVFAGGQVTSRHSTADGYDRLTVDWLDQVGDPHTSTFTVDVRPRYEVGEPFALRYNPDHPQSGAVVDDASQTTNFDIVYELSLIPATLALIALGAVGQVVLRRRRIRKALAWFIVLTWLGVDDVTPHVPETGTAWDLPDTRRAWWRGIATVFELFGVNLVLGGAAYLVKEKAAFGSWGATLAAAVVSFAAIGGTYAVVRGRLWWLLRSRAWQLWHGTPARPSGRYGKAPPVIRISGVRPDGQTVTALLRTSRWSAEPDASLGEFGPLLVVRGRDRLALAAAPGEQAAIRVARLPRTVRQHAYWTERFDEWQLAPADD